MPFGIDVAFPYFIIEAGATYLQNLGCLGVVVVTRLESRACSGVNTIYMVETIENFYTCVNM
jgi:hypothetical protein